jgi:hypothetical protein
MRGFLSMGAVGMGQRQQEREEVATGSVRTDIIPGENDVRPATTSEIGITSKAIFDARRIRDAEQASPREPLSIQSGRETLALKRPT